MDNEFYYVHSKTNEMGQVNGTTAILVASSPSTHIFFCQMIMAMSHDISTRVIVITLPMKDV